MKKSLLFFLSINISISFAVVHTVSNNPNIPAQYTNFPGAFSLASPGDTIYIHGSVTDYTIATITKAITIIGPGFNPDKQYRLPASFNTTLSITASNVHIYGINNKTFSIALSFGVTNCTISRCYFNNITMFNNNTNILIEGCCWPTGPAGLLLAGQNNTVINCVMSNITFQAGTQNCTIDHNTFIIGAASFSNLTNSWISNNIFYAGIGINPPNNNSFNNNLSTVGFALPGAGNVGAGHVVGTALYTDYSAARPFYYYNNFTLTALSPGKNIATDGTDVGATGGGNPFASEGEVKTIPIIREMDIMTPIVPSPGNINVHIRATQPK